MFIYATRVRAALFLSLLLALPAPAAALELLGPVGSAPPRVLDLRAAVIERGGKRVRASVSPSFRTEAGLSSLATLIPLPGPLVGRPSVSSPEALERFERALGLRRVAAESGIIPVGDDSLARSEPAADGALSDVEVLSDAEAVRAWAERGGWALPKGWEARGGEPDQWLALTWKPRAASGKEGALFTAGALPLVTFTYEAEERSLGLGSLLGRAGTSATLYIGTRKALRTDVFKGAGRVGADLAGAGFGFPFIPANPKRVRHEQPELRTSMFKPSELPASARAIASGSGRDEPLFVRALLFERVPEEAASLSLRLPHAPGPPEPERAAAQNPPERRPPPKPYVAPKRRAEVPKQVAAPGCAQGGGLAPGGGAFGWWIAFGVVAVGARRRRSA